MSRFARIAAAMALLFCGALALPAGESYVALVPWRVVERDSTVDAPLALFWIPASVDELRRSPMLTSDDLTLFSSQCVAMRVVRLNDNVRVTSLAADTALPIAVLTDRAGKVIGRVESDDEHELSVIAVEEMVRDAIDHRAEETDSMLDRGRELADAKDVDGAAAIYRVVWDERCLCPRQGREAGKALRKLGKKLDR
jgi:hypothetical protein